MLLDQIQTVRPPVQTCLYLQKWHFLASKSTKKVAILMFVPVRCYILVYIGVISAYILQTKSSYMCYVLAGS